MTAAIVVLFSVVIFIICLHLYAKWFWRNAQLSQHRQELNYAIDEPIEVTGLEKAVVESLPTFTYAGESMRKGIECAVCLCEFEEKETGRLLPTCNHLFHTECIDMWFRSHSTCPLCRVSIMPTTTAKAEIVECSTIMDSLGNSLLPQSTSSSVSIDFSSLDNVLLSEERSHQPQMSEENADATALQQVQGISSVTHLEGLQQPAATESKTLNKQQGQLSSLSFSQREGSLRVPPHLTIELPRPCSDPTCASCSRSGHSSASSGLCPKSPLGRFSLRRILSRDRKIAPSASTSADCEEGAFPALCQLHHSNL
ncbi:hypothetical protein O6H91_09G012100 [Diphasiastrum complanatum]|nr:hypothetical protein O6H91_09G012100 [Diphasiastrum complanatum]